VLPGGVHARGVEVCYLVGVEFYDGYAVVYVTVFCEIGFQRCDADGHDGLDFGEGLRNAVLGRGEVPQCEVYVVDVAVDEYAA
jgi:hypothetical protein